ncbi:MAG TPA: trypsin-like peptidase domain-containing protein [Acidimicrobiales bacterium]
MTWISPPATSHPSPVPTAAWEVPESWGPPESWEALESTTATGWGRRAMAIAVIIGFLASFVGARILAGPNGPLADGARRLPGAQFLPLPSEGSGRTDAPVSAEAAAVADKVRPGVVDINTELAFQHATAAGTGMVLTEDGRVLTNNHIIEGATAITATVVETGKSYPATVVGTDASGDIALLQLKGASGLDTVAIGDSDTVRVGDRVVSLGNAGGLGGQPSVKEGTVEAVGQDLAIGDPARGGFHQLENLIATTVPLQSGDSGGPLVDAGGEVIGIDTAASVPTRFQSTEAMGFAIPIADAMAVVRQIESGQATDTVHIGPTAFLGVSLVTGGGPGVLVAGVASGSPADDAGLEEGDTITAADGQAVDSGDALSTVIRAHRPGDKVGLQWTDRDGDRHSTTVELATGPA